ncbi:hypothetical protein llap_6219 [Limosa lapponica baueri]|uniref:Cyclic nucleotide-binding domain-containing protein n=1 Tax=Limosa lapponica baueri TaxID=1758121 RepID=A0A2I0UBR5_LIMLA|nr:hypothetical protein llap_6219 [Limosa lapponica baueri]
MGRQFLQEDTVGHCIEGLAEVQLNNIHRLSFIHQAGHFVIEGDLEDHLYVFLSGGLYTWRGSLGVYLLFPEVTFAASMKIPGEMLSRTRQKECKQYSLEQSKYEQIQNLVEYEKSQEMIDKDPFESATLT